MLGVSLAMAAGLAMAAQGRINGALGVELHDALLAAVISFGGGLLVLVAMLPLTRTMRAGLRRLAEALRGGSLSPWQCLGGVGGAMFVAGQSVTVGVLGVSLFTVGVVAGQTVSGLFVDRAGLGPAGAQRLSVTRVLGAVLTLVAVAWSVSGGLNLPGGPGRLWLLALPMVAGVFVAVQQAINGHVGKVSGSALTAALTNFTVGTIVLVLAWLVSLLVSGGPTAAPDNPVLYLGGLVGIVFIALASFVVRLTGVLLLGLAAIAGQLIGSVLLDVFLPAAGHPLTATTVGGTALALVAVVIAGMGGPRERRARLEQ
ncbi:transporter family-2 protein [Amycolatopsis marina]|uniref:Transporter family-2 protein n=1 Tax=Amycolatopsis marina TaxID=490629 RepID=A0A1I1A3I2_9PSEU|nr:transporter family-2 protein [Amycolatopsis marina]